MVRFLAGLVAAVALLAWSPSAHPEGPHTRASCPEGAALTGPADGPQFCVPQDCEGDEACGPGRVCRDQPLCIERVGGVTGPKNAVGKCGAEGTCPAPQACEQASKRCVRSGLVERYRSSCGCGVPGTGAGGAGAVGVALGLAALLASRRARRSPPRARLSWARGRIPVAVAVGGALTGCAALLSVGDVTYVADSGAPDDAPPGDARADAAADGADAADAAPNDGAPEADTPFCPPGDGAPLPFCADFDRGVFAQGWTQVENARGAAIFAWPDASTSAPYSLMVTTSTPDTSQVDLFRRFLAPPNPQTFSLAFDLWVERAGGFVAAEIVHLTFGGPAKPYFQVQVVLDHNGTELGVELYDGTTKGYPLKDLALTVTPGWHHLVLAGDLAAPSLTLSVDALKATLSLSPDAGVAIKRLPPSLTLGVPHIGIVDGGSDYRLAFDSLLFDCH